MVAGSLPAALVHEVRLAAAARRELWAAVARIWPNEAVLLLGGRHCEQTMRVDCCLALAAATGPDYFRADAVDFVRLEAALRARGHQWLGFAHSHPNGPAALSTIDRTELWRDCLQVVVGTRGPQATAAAAFWLHGEQLRRLPMQVVDEAPA